MTPPKDTQTGPETPTLWIGQKSDTGRYRPCNEDHVGYLVPEDEGQRRRKGALFLVADGMGGHQAGEVASRQAVERVKRAYYADPDSRIGPSLVRAFQTVNRALYEQAQAHPAQTGMGTTLVAAVVQSNQAVIANVGDSRAYHLHRGRLTQLTTDHSWVEEQVRNGVLTRQQARRHPQRNVITRALGVRPAVAVDLFEVELQTGDALLLCTDGLSEALSARQMARPLRSRSPRRAAAQLVDQASARSRDNISALVVRAGQPPPGGVQPLHLLAGLPVLLGLCLAAAVALGLLFTGQRLAGDPVAAPQAAPLYYDHLSRQEAATLAGYVARGELRGDGAVRLRPGSREVELWPTEPGLFLVGSARAEICGDRGCFFPLTMADATYRVYYQPPLLADDADLVGRQVRVFGIQTGAQDALSARLIEVGEAWWAWWRRPPWTTVYRDPAWRQPVWVYGTVDRSPNGLLTPGEYSALQRGDRVLSRGQWEQGQRSLLFLPGPVYRLQEEQYAPTPP